ncbi:hypothetical protein O7628_14175 [Micromonospora sp. WMMD956]|uniref:hypothetical protein n=1 Tax=Micromonospora TaxID=1873 RepID=UPI002416BA09|nr:hypothetical protein [Micromonospora sp. WMMD956]MDG4816640.1 hypothetical protein [Micromonospora sp. WMMD956]
MRPRVALVLAVVAILVGSAMLVPAAYAKLSGDDDGSGGGEAEAVAAPEPTAPPPPTLAAGPVSVNFTGEFFSWALMDRESGSISGSKNLTRTSSTESMIKAWFAADYLRQLGGRELTATLKKTISAAIRDSDDDAANLLYKVAGREDSIERMIKICRLTDTGPGNVRPYIGWWSFTQMSPRDAVRLGDCIGDGKAAGAKWTPYLLDEMSKVRGSVKDQRQRSGGGKWGIVDGLPAEIKAQGPVSIKNGWTPLNYDGNWHVNCLAVTEKWSLAVMLRYPQKLGLSYGAKVCASVTTQLVTPQPGAALKVPQQPIGKL